MNTRARNYLNGSKHKEKKSFSLPEIETSKLIIGSVMFTYYVGVVVGVLFVLKYGEGLDSWLTFIGSAVVIALPVYGVKAGIENKRKIIASMEKDLKKLEHQLKKEIDDYIEGEN